MGFGRCCAAVLLLASAGLPASAAGSGTKVVKLVDVPTAWQPEDTTGWCRLGGGAAAIQYTLPKAGRVRVRVFDASGREVARPVDEWQTAGAHMTMFAFGPSTKRQVFHYRVECGTRKSSGKVVIEP